MSIACEKSCFIKQLTASVTVGPLYLSPSLLMLVANVTELGLIKFHTQVRDLNVLRAL